MMKQDLSGLRIDRSKKQAGSSSGKGWKIVSFILFVTFDERDYPCDLLGIKCDVFIRINKIE